jgi:hypothetical protein
MKKTKSRSPDLIGQLHVQRHTLREIVKQAHDSDQHEVPCNLAAWRNEDNAGKIFLTVELSPWFMPRSKRKAKRDIFEDLFGDDNE